MLAWPMRIDRAPRGRSLARTHSGHPLDRETARQHNTDTVQPALLYHERELPTRSWPFRLHLGITS